MLDMRVGNEENMCTFDLLTNFLRENRLFEMEYKVRG